METVVGEGIVKAAELSLKHKIPFITVVSSGGAHMQEGILSLMQMARTTAVINLLSDDRMLLTGANALVILRLIQSYRHVAVSLVWRYLLTAKQDIIGS